MKLNKILEAVKFDPNEKENDFLGSGLYVDVHRDKKDSNMLLVNKYGTIRDISRSGWSEVPLETRVHANYVYAKYIMQNKLWQKNIHFPRVYRIGASISPKDDYKSIEYHINTERLFSAENASEMGREELIVIIKTCFHEKDYGDLPNDEKNSPWYLDDDPFAAQRKFKARKFYVAKLDWLLEKMFDNKIQPKLGTLKKGLQMLRTIYQKANAGGPKLGSWGLDVGIRNIMFRRTPFGYQMVFNDPFSGVGVGHLGVKVELTK